jgi:outer membrane protein TolC
MTGNSSLIDLNQKLSSGVNTVRNGVSNKSLNSGVTASMLLFNGFQVKATKARLDMLQKQSLTVLNMQIQNTIAAIMAEYYDVIRQQNYLNIIRSTIDQSSKKLEIVKNRYNVGMANEADLLQAQMDLNAAEQNLKEQQLAIGGAKTNLLQTMGVKKFSDVSVQDTIIPDRTIQKEAVIDFLDKNPLYISAEQQVKINEQIVKEKKSLRYPVIRVNGGYNYTYNSSSAGFNLFTKNYGPAVGATLAVPIFNGNISKTSQKVASLNVKNAEIERENVLHSLKADALKTLDNYSSTLQQIDSQEKNYRDATKLVNIILQRFRLNQATILEVKAAQSSFEAAANTLANLQFSAKVAEIELKRLTSELGKN